MKTPYKILIGVVITTLVAIISFYIYFPILLAGPIGPLQFDLHNNDTNEHNITVEVFDYKNKSIFKETYELGSKEEASTPVITKRRGEYVFNVTVDDEITRTSKTYVGYGQDGLVRINVYIKDPISGEINIIGIVQIV
ncbi:MAG: hypothetical protein U9N61_07960 [Euryarchaeota archaeon]|nr:hypothetical protein [Euryarchaeota archaeon]